MGVQAGIARKKHRQARGHEAQEATIPQRAAAGGWLVYQTSPSAPGNLPDVLLRSSTRLLRGYWDGTGMRWEAP